MELKYQIWLCEYKKVSQVRTHCSDGGGGRGSGSGYGKMSPDTILPPPLQCV